MQLEKDLTIAVFCNRKDLFLAKICVASIRYYYPLIQIELIKDAANGEFDTKELEIYFKVKLIDLGIAKMGWGASKIHYIALLADGKKVLMLDADIVFVGPFLERLKDDLIHHDWIVSSEEVFDPNDPYIFDTYFDYARIKLEYPNYLYPGFVFNTGQLLVTGGAILKIDLDPYFDFDKYPFWKRRDLFPLVDQSLLNIMLPILSLKKRLKISKQKFMIWGMSDAALNLSIKAIKDKSSTQGLIHWAGGTRIPYVRKMSRGDILLFFEDYYYKKVSFGIIKKMNARTISYMDFHIRKIYRKTLKKIFKKSNIIQ